MKSLILALVLTASDCNTCEDCNCPPFVCEQEMCQENYGVFLTAEWCGPCKQMYPVVDQLRKQGCRVYVYDIDKYPEVRGLYNVRVTPTFVIMHNGAEVQRHEGVTSTSSIRRNLSSQSVTFESLQKFRQALAQTLSRLKNRQRQTLKAVIDNPVFERESGEKNFVLKRLFLKVQREKPQSLKLLTEYEAMAEWVVENIEEYSKWLLLIEPRIVQE